MWCHLCIIEFISVEEFKYHITRYHSRISSPEWPEPQRLPQSSITSSSEGEESEHEIADVSERKSDEGESYDSDHNIPAEKKSDESDAYINTSPGLFHYDSDRSITTENISDNYDADFAENDSYEKTVALNESPSKISQDDSKAHVSDTLLGKRKKYSKKSNIKASGSNETPKKVKNRVRRQRKKVKKVSASSHQEDIPEQSDNNETDHSENSFDEESNTQPVLNFLNPNSSINSHRTSNNNSARVMIQYEVVHTETIKLLYF